jgi:hypothetical protein
MSSLLTLAANLVAPPLLIAWMAFYRSGNRVEAVLVALAVAAYLVLVWRMGPVWSWVGNYWPGVFAGLYALGLAMLVLRTLHEPSLPADGRTWVRVAFIGIVGVVLIVQAGLVLRARAHPAPALALEFPLRGGTFQVAQGGRGGLVNHHYGLPAQRYALDIVALGPRGVRAAGIMPADVTRYVVFGLPVHAPCAGEILDVRGDRPDGTELDSDPATAAGNHVTIHCDGHTVLLAHLQQGSPAVARGDRVVAGQVVGRAGSSGNVTEPHLHIHAAAGLVADHQALITDATGVPLTFGGRFLIRNDVINS